MIDDSDDDDDDDDLDDDSDDDDQDDDQDDDDDDIDTITSPPLPSSSSLVRKELRVLSRLDEIPISRATRRQVSQLLAASSLDSASSASSPHLIRIDVSKGGKHVVSFLNNLEKDPMYRGMPRSLKVM
jgi:hypothetical protein